MKSAYSPRHLEMALKTAYRRALEHPDGYGKNTGDCGDTVEIYLVLQHEHIQEITYLTDGCLDTNACANVVADMAANKPLADAWRITPDRIIADLITLDSSHHHCAELAVGALYRALADARTNLEMPWKKLYRHGR